MKCRRTSHNVPVKKLLLDKDFNLDRIDINQKLIFLCSPNNPTGNLLDVQSVLDQFKGIVVVDEAYIDFSSKPGFISKIDQYPNLIVLQTFSKAWGLAGLRLGMAFAHNEIISLLNKIKPPYNISVTTQKLALQALAKEGQTTEWISSIKSERERVARELSKLTSVKKVFPSEANFLLVRIDNAADGYTTISLIH